MMLRFLGLATFAVMLILGSGGARAQEDGAALYVATCSSCHQFDGTGVSGAFPPLANHVGDLYVEENGRRYLVDVVLFGLEGAIRVHGNNYDGTMPGWFQMDDAEIAAILNHVMTSWGDDADIDFEPYAPAEVSSARGGALSPQLVHQRRPDLGEAEVSETAVDLPPATFSAAQVDRITGTYNRLCADCHGESLEGGLIGGPPLTGPFFEQRWSGRTVDSLFQFTKARMPLDRPDSLSAQQYADLTALILSYNSHEPGEELTGDPELLEGSQIK